MSKRTTATFNEVMRSAGEWLTVTKVAQRFGVHPDTIRRWAANGRIKSVRHPANNYRLFLLDDIEGG